MIICFYWRDKFLNNAYTESENLNIWFKANQLTVIIMKTHYMMFHRTRIKHNIKILLNNRIIHYTNAITFL